MLGMDGADVAAAIRCSAFNARSHIVALTAHGSRDSVSAEQLVHFDEFLTKPVAPETLHALLQFYRVNDAQPSDSRSLKPIHIADCLRKSSQRSELALQLLKKFLSGLPETTAHWRDPPKGAISNKFTRWHSNFRAPTSVLRGWRTLSTRYNQLCTCTRMEMLFWAIKFKPLFQR
jgi:CheY-like chemotaxis protein